MIVIMLFQEIFSSDRHYQNKIVGKTGRTYGRGTSNRAAMRIAGAGLVNPDNLEGAIWSEFIMSSPSHATQHSFSGACGIACGISEVLKMDSSILSVTKACIYGNKKGT